MQGSIFRLCLGVLCLSCSSIYKMKLLAPPPCQYFKLMLLYHNLFSPSLSLHCPSVFCNNTHVWIIRICWRQPRRRPTQSLVFLACSVIQVSDHQQTPFLALSSSPPPLGSVWLAMAPRQNAGSRQVLGCSQCSFPRCERRLLSQ